MVANGLGKKILINTPYNLFGDWSAFSLRYSLNRFLPEAEVYLVKSGVKKDGRQYFSWLAKMKVKQATDVIPDMIFDSTVIMIRPMEEVFEVSDAKEDKFTPFVSYVDGCAKFVMSEWINKDEYPFPHADSFMSKNACVNEIQILKLWKQMNALYPLVAGG